MDCKGLARTLSFLQLTEVTGSSENLALIYQATKNNIPEVPNLGVKVIM